MIVDHSGPVSRGGVGPLAGIAFRGLTPHCANRRRRNDVPDRTLIPLRLTGTLAHEHRPPRSPQSHDVYHAACDEWYARFDGRSTTEFGGDTPLWGLSHVVVKNKFPPSGSSFPARMDFRSFDPLESRHENSAAIWRPTGRPRAGSSVGTVQPAGRPDRNERPERRAPPAGRRTGYFVGDLGGKDEHGSVALERQVPHGGLMPPDCMEQKTFQENRQ
jgi:hypothetical protein